MSITKRPVRDICREVGQDPLQFNEVLRRIRRDVSSGQFEVITHAIGTFYLSKRKATTKVTNGNLIQVPAREVVALRGPRFPGRDQPLVQSVFTVNDERRQPGQLPIPTAKVGEARTVRRLERFIGRVTIDATLMVESSFTSVSSSVDERQILFTFSGAAFNDNGNIPSRILFRSDRESEFTETNSGSPVFFDFSASQVLFVEMQRVPPTGAPIISVTIRSSQVPIDDET